MFNVLFVSGENKEKLLGLNKRIDDIVNVTAVVAKTAEGARVLSENIELRRKVEDLEKFARDTKEQAAREVRAAADERDRRVQILNDEHQRTTNAVKETHEREMAALREEFERKEREVLHMVGLEQKRQAEAAKIAQKDVEHARRDAELKVRETNLAEERKRFEQQMKFVTDRFTMMENYMRETQGQILERLPNVNMNINREETATTRRRG